MTASTTPDDAPYASERPSFTIAVPRGELLNRMASEKLASRATLHMVARLHYEADLPQVEIARRLGVSAATVSRLLRRAREEGVVRIEIQSLAPRDDLSRDLQIALNLKSVALADGSSTSPLTEIADPLSSLLQANLKNGSILAIGWGRAVREVVRTGLPRVPGVTVVPATGGMQQPAPHFQINEFVRLAAEQMGGEPRFIHAPSLMAPETRKAFLGDPAIKNDLALWNRVDVALVGVGMSHAVDPVHAAAATATERAIEDAAGDVIRHYFNARGKILKWVGADNLVGISVSQLRAAPLVIGVAVGPEKASAIVGAARARLISALVTNVQTAQAILDQIGA